MAEKKTGADVEVRKLTFKHLKVLRKEGLNPFNVADLPPEKISEFVYRVLELAYTSKADIAKVDELDWDEMNALTDKILKVSFGIGGIEAKK